MSIRFNPEYELLIGRSDLLLNYVLPRGLSLRYINNGSSDEGVPVVGGFNNLPKRFQRFTDYKLTAKLPQTKNQSVPAEISVYNLSEDAINRFKKNDLVILRAGYKQTSGDFLFPEDSVEDDQQQPDVFVGQIVRVSTKFTGADKITSILCGDCITVKKNSKVSRSYIPGLSRLSVLKDLTNLAKDQGIPLGFIKIPDEGTTEYNNLVNKFLTGYTAKGLLFNEIERLCSSVGMRSFTALGKLYIEPAYTLKTEVKNYVQKFEDDDFKPKKVAVQTSSVIFTATPAQLKGTVTPLDESSGPLSNTNGQASKTGLKVRLFLDGRVSINRIFRLKDFEDDNINGDYEITSVVHLLDYRGKLWDTELTIKRL